jgi:arginyl-tRNA synthetase
VLDEPEEKRAEVFRIEGVELMLESIKRSLADFGAEFDVYFSEATLHANGEIEEAVTRLREQGHVFDADGAVWLRTTDFGDDKDRVLVRSDGRPTYFNADCAYYLDKRRRGADRLVYLLGADHHGYVGRLRAIAAAFGDDPDQTIEVIIGQLVSLHGGRMSKRAGNLVTLDEGMRLIGTDALRYALVRWSMDSPIDIDVELWAARTNDNPVFYVQYAHARLASLGRNARELGVSLPPLAEIDYGLLSHEREGDLLRALGEFPRVAAAAAELRAPHRVARYLEELAGTYHRFYDVCRVLPSEHEDSPGPDLVHARLALCEATRIVLENGLGLIGVSAPDRM